MENFIDFTNCQIDFLSNYEGSDQKRGIIYKGKRYMLKFSDRIDTAHRTDLHTSYSNSIYSEYICCHIVESLGYPVQNTLLGFISGKTREGEAVNIPVVACENFIPNNYELKEFKKIASDLLINKPKKIPMIEEIYDILGVDNLYFSGKFRERALERYWDTFIIDALLGNFDRHGNNWGYLIEKNTKQIQFAPIYDCGSCLYPQLNENQLLNIISDENEIIKRIRLFPTAALMINNSKVNYGEYIYSMKNSDCSNALLRVYPKINLDVIYSIIDNTPIISDERKQFYKVMIEKRMDYILTPAYELLTKEYNLDEENEYMI